MNHHFIPYWYYNPEDITTWKYILTENKERRPKSFWILNPEFKYKHLDPLDPDYRKR
jgi:hypothetical protein